VDPTEGFYVPLTDKELVAMLDVRRREEILSRDAAPSQDTKWDDCNWVLERLQDRQLTAAVRAIQGKIDSGEWTPTGEKGLESGKLAGDELRQLNEYQERLLRELERAEKRMDALESGNAAQTADRTDLWDDKIDLTGGKLEVRDKDGKVIALFNITGKRLERWLFDADIEKVDINK
jgi:hypothetical protein